MTSCCCNLCTPMKHNADRVWFVHNTNVKFVASCQTTLIPYTVIADSNIYYASFQLVAQLCHPVTEIDRVAFDECFFT